MRILDNEKAEILGSPLTSGFGVTGASALGVTGVSSFCGVSTAIFPVVFSVSG
ncbi:hypothetical protein KHA90_09340 [Flavobacterium psychroterrae]|uniref:Bacteriocin n=1 Tax=Flavobacterium psychroterrae TaxID=2133767 RepID=A0ABS5PA96_9FLAO|nr:hypothetical protein [Flavobacterium psychroterrae]MBS7231228.1 hypothetical protein [Flavobacterium psychroterrae]